MTDIRMPQFTDQMEEGTIVTWLADAGASVAAGADLVEVETDKASMTHATDVAGTLEIVVPAGETVAVGTVIARVGAVVAPASAPAAPAPAPAPAPAAAPAPATPNGVSATPLALRFAGTHGVALATLTGSGPRGRITKADVLRAAGVTDPEPTSPPAPTSGDPHPHRGSGSPLTPDETATVRPATRLQQLIARRMVESKTTVPHFQVQTEVVMDEAMALRGRLKQLAGDGDPVPSFNDLIVRACAVALREHPLANGSWVADGFELHDRVNVGIAVAADGALVVPTIFDADTKSLAQISRESRRLAGRVRDGEIAPAELTGGTFTVSNLGMYGMTAIVPVVNAPQAAILGVGATREVLARVDGEIVERALLTLTLSCDHRILYGADAALFLSAVRTRLEAPLGLAL